MQNVQSINLQGLRTLPTLKQMLMSTADSRDALIIQTRNDALYEYAARRFVADNVSK